MYQVIEQSHDEKMKMYMKLSKNELAEMLIASNNYLEFITKQQYYQPPFVPVDPVPYQPFIWRAPVYPWEGPFYTTCSSDMTVN